MTASMVITISSASGYGKVKRQRISVPRIAALLEPPSRYREAHMPKPASTTVLPRLSHGHHPTDRVEKHRPAQPAMRRERAPSMRALVKLALECETAEQLGMALRRRYERNQRRVATDRLQRELDQRLAEVEREAKR